MRVVETLCLIAAMLAALAMVSPALMGGLVILSAYLEK